MWVFGVNITTVFLPIRLDHVKEKHMQTHTDPTMGQTMREKKDETSSKKEQRNKGIWH